MEDSLPPYRLLSAICEAFRHRRVGEHPRPSLHALIRELEGYLASQRGARAIQTVPPRRVTVAMAQALHGQPHLAITWGDVTFDGHAPVPLPEPWVADAPLRVSDEVIGAALQLSPWESEELRDELDRRTGRELKQARALQWMWSQFGLPSASPWGLFRVLFPGLSLRQPDAHLLRIGAYLYAIPADVRAPSLAALFLPWLGGDPDRLVPLTTFQIRSVDRALKRAMARSVGANEAELDTLLAHMITALPAEGLADFIALDSWRTRGPATLTGLASPYGGASWLGTLPADDEIDHASWLRSGGGRLELLDDPRLRFDALATQRVQAMLHQIYAGLLARLHPDFSAGPELCPLDLDLLDLEHHLNAVLDPLIDWPRSPAVHQRIAQAHGLSVESTAEHLLQLAQQWEERARTHWFGLPGPGQRPTVYSVLMPHLVTLSASLRALAHTPADPRAEHLGVLLLFAGHYLAEAPIERLWQTHRSSFASLPTDPIPPEDPIGTWFWPCWRATLTALTGP